MYCKNAITENSCENRKIRDWEQNLSVGIQKLWKSADLQYLYPPPPPTFNTVCLLVHPLMERPAFCSRLSTDYREVSRARLFYTLSFQRCLQTFISNQWAGKWGITEREKTYVQCTSKLCIATKLTSPFTSNFHQLAPQGARSEGR